MNEYSVIVGFPYSGTPCMGFDTAKALYRCSRQHRASIFGISGSWGNFNQILAECLNRASEGKVTHMAFLHADIAPEEWWVDVLMAEMERLGADVVSALVPIKDLRGISSSGIGDSNDRWHPLRRFTMQEAYEFPETFDAKDAGYPGSCLLHNDGCFLMDLRNPIFRKTDDNGVLVASFDFPRRIRLVDGKFTTEGESEDWYWSRKLHELGAKTYITRKVKLNHEGGFCYPNTGIWGTYQSGDEDTKTRWQPEASLR